MNTFKYILVVILAFISLAFLSACQGKTITDLYFVGTLKVIETNSLDIKTFETSEVAPPKNSSLTFPALRMISSELALQLRINSAVSSWEIENKSNSSIVFKFDELTCEHKGKDQKKSIPVHRFATGTGKDEKSRRSSPDTGVAVEISPNSNQWVTYSIKDTRETLSACLTDGDQKTFQGGVDLASLIGKDLIINLPFEANGRTGYYSFQLTLKNSANRTSYF